MIRFLLRRLSLGVVVMFMVTVAIYGMFYLGAPMDIARRLAGRNATPATVEMIYKNLGLNRPLWMQYRHFLWRLLHGDLGTDYYHQLPVTTVLKQDAPVTISLALGAAVIWFVLGVATGVYSSTHPRTFLDRTFTAGALFFYSIPVFVLGVTLRYFFFYRLTLHKIKWFPAEGYVSITSSPFEWARHLVLPWLTLALISAAAYTRLSRTSMLEVLSEDYIRTARSKGLSERRVVLRHALRSALTPVVTQFGIDFASVLGGAILTESVWGLPGLGRESVTAITNQDLPVIIGIVIIAAAAIILANILVDMAYAVLDPRVRLH
ncbi:MAG TPA: ABC transporter permease [Acidothermaceae bacterium]|jgi:peptide/nickel transport system permease protein|nr:ABC transporter permease [Acidothermaceae bacterium]